MIICIVLSFVNICQCCISEMVNLKVILCEKFEKALLQNLSISMLLKLLLARFNIFFLRQNRSLSNLRISRELKGSAMPHYSLVIT